MPDELKTLHKSSIPLYLQVRDLVMHRILLGEWKAGSRLPTDRELSAALGINHITLGKALNMLRDEGVLIRTRGNGTFVADSLPQNIAPSPQKRRSVGVFFDELTPKTFSSELFAGLFTTMDANALAMELYSAKNSGDCQCRQLMEVAQSGEVAGGIVWSVMSDTQLREVMQSVPTHFPLIFLDRIGVGVDQSDWSGQDDYRAGWLLGDAMRRRGLKKSICIERLENSTLSTNERRIQGFSDAFAAPVETHHLHIATADLSVQVMQSVLAEFAIVEPTALFCPSETVAKPLYLYLSQTAFPADIVPCYIQSSAVLPMTRVALDTRAMGETAVRILLARMRGDAKSKFSRESLCKLIEVK